MKTQADCPLRVGAAGVKILALLPGSCVGFVFYQDLILRARLPRVMDVAGRMLPTSP